MLNPPLLFLYWLFCMFYLVFYSFRKQQGSSAYLIEVVGSSFNSIWRNDEPGETSSVNCVKKLFSTLIVLGLNVVITVSCIKKYLDTSMT